MLVCCSSAETVLRLDGTAPELYRALAGCTAGCTAPSSVPPQTPRSCSCGCRQLRRQQQGQWCGPQPGEQLRLAAGAWPCWHLPTGRRCGLACHVHAHLWAEFGHMLTGSSWGAFKGIIGGVGLLTGHSGEARLGCARSLVLLGLLNLLLQPPLLLDLGRCRRRREVGCGGRLNTCSSSARGGFQGLQHGGGLLFRVLLADQQQQPESHKGPAGGGEAPSMQRPTVAGGCGWQLQLGPCWSSRADMSCGLSVALQLLLLLPV